MHLLYASTKDELINRSVLFEKYMEPNIVSLETQARNDHVPKNLPELETYFKVCRWPFRKLEYSFVLDAISEYVKPDSCFLDAGCGVTPLPNIFASLGVAVEACDFDSRQINVVKQFQSQKMYFDSRINYSVQDLTSVAYHDEMFDVISCVSVIEHIPAPQDQAAIKELIRILKPGGLLIITLDFMPPNRENHQGTRYIYYLQRMQQLFSQGKYNEIINGFRRKVQAQQSIQNGQAHHARSANQCFEVDHLRDDIAPLIENNEILSHLPYSTDLYSVTPDQAKGFWDLEPGLFDNEGRRFVLPVGVLYKKKEKFDGSTQ